ncbi:unnamed protein product [Heligmosomoides polygyrus]|uniref:GAGA-binding transcriptional activator n=1 Tax=Heligmosomoides polygyrus TaxID=6339 RepID=A0A3P8AZJ6_HELPZ|nr:unnamed protein product [Heligmosomoides polygyrus]
MDGIEKNLHGLEEPRCVNADELEPYRKRKEGLLHVKGKIKERKRSQLVKMSQAEFAPVSWSSPESPHDARYLDLMGKSTDFSASDLKRVNRAYSCWGYMNKNGCPA